MARFCVVIAFEGESRDRFVVVHHRSRGWELPGGRLEEGEAPLDAARREFYEETGHDLRGARLVDVGPSSPWDHVVVGFLGPASPARPREESVDGWRLVSRLDDVGPLSFPDDPYDRLAAAVGRPLRT